MEQFDRTDRVFPYRFADREEAAELYLSNTAYFAGATPYDLQFRLQRKDATVDSPQKHPFSRKATIR